MIINAYLVIQEKIKEAWPVLAFVVQTGFLVI